MHCLEVIEHRNQVASGREAAHAANDGDHMRAIEILDASGPGPQRATKAFNDGVDAGLQEG